MRRWEDVLERSVAAPWWEMSSVTAELLLKHGFSYDHSQSYRDVPFYARVGDRWSTIDYSTPAADWMHPLAPGREIDLVDIGANWYIDDLPPMRRSRRTSAGAISSPARRARRIDEPLDGSRPDAS